MGRTWGQKYNNCYNQKDAKHVCWLHSHIIHAFNTTPMALVLNPCLCLLNFLFHWGFVSFSSSWLVVFSNLMEWIRIHEFSEGRTIPADHAGIQAHCEWFHCPYLYQGWQPSLKLPWCSSLFPFPLAFVLIFFNTINVSPQKKGNKLVLIFGVALSLSVVSIMVHGFDFFGHGFSWSYIFNQFFNDISTRYVVHSQRILQAHSNAWAIAKYLEWPDHLLQHLQYPNLQGCGWSGSQHPGLVAASWLPSFSLVLPECQSASLWYQWDVVVVTHSILDLWLLFHLPLFLQCCLNITQIGIGGITEIIAFGSISESEIILLAFSQCKPRLTFVWPIWGLGWWNRVVC